MPLVGHLDADYEAFHRETEKAVGELNALATAGTKVGPAVGSLVDQLAPAMKNLEARIEETKTKIAQFEEETARAGTTAGGAASSGIGKFGASLDQVDKTLGVLGVHIGPEVGAIKELGAAAAGGGESLGALGVAGLVVGAGVAGWKIGRAVADFFDLDNIIGKASASLLGFGDVAAETAAVKADVLARASKLAGTEIKDLALAMAINEEAAKKHGKAIGDLDDAFTRAKGPAESAKQLAGWRAELDKITAGGLVAGLTADLKSHNFTNEQLAERYKISTAALGLFSRDLAESDKIAASNKEKLDAVGKSIKALAEEHEKAAKKIADANKEQAEFTAHVNFQMQTLQERLATINPQTATLATSMLAAGLSISEVARASKLTVDQVQALAERQRELKRDTDASATAAEKHAAALKSEADKAAELAAAVAKAAAELKELNRQRGGSFDVTSSNFSETIAGLNLGGTGIDPIALAREGYSFQEIVAILRGGRKGAPVGPPIPGFGGTSSSSQSGTTTPSRSPTPTSIGGSGGGLGGGGAISPGAFVFNLYGTPKELVDLVKDELIKTARAGRQFSAG